MDIEQPLPPLSFSCSSPLSFQCLHVRLSSTSLQYIFSAAIFCKSVPDHSGLAASRGVLGKMARGGRVIYKNNHGRKRKPRSKEDDEEEGDDEEYVLGEDDDEGSESSYEFDDPSPDEDSYEFDEEEKAKISRSRTNRWKSRVSDDEMEDSPVLKKKGWPVYGKQRNGDSDYEVEAEDEDDEDFLPNVDEFDEDEVSLATGRKGGKNIGKRVRSEVWKPKGRKKRKDVVSPSSKSLKKSTPSSDDDFVVKDRVSFRRKKRANKGGKGRSMTRRKRPWADSESIESDFVFSDEDDFVLEEDQVMANRKKISQKVKGPRGRGRKKRLGMDSPSSDSDYVVSDDDGYITRNQVLVDKQQNKDKVKKEAGPNRRKMKSVDSKSSDSDYKVSEDDELTAWEPILVDQQRRKKDKVKERAVSKTRRKRLSVDSESLDSDYKVSEDDVLMAREPILVDQQRKKKDKVKEQAISKTRRKGFSFDSDSLDSDYNVSEDDEFTMDQTLVGKQRMNDKVKGAAVSKTKRKGLSVDSDSSDSDYNVSEDDELTAKDQILVGKQRKDKVKEHRVTKRKRKRLSGDSESSDSDYLISEDDDFIAENRLVVHKQKKNNKGRRMTAECSTRRRRTIVVSESSDYKDGANYEEETKDRRLEWGFNQQKLGQIVVGRKKEVKGKEKEQEVNELAKQVCGICLSEEQKGVVQGLLNCCMHYFCFACIMEWSKVESRCPVCKRRFVTITKSGRSDPGFGMRKAVISVEQRDQVYLPSQEELRDMLDPYENVVCMECHQGGDDNLMLLCDICDSSAHTFCVGLGREVPEGNWYCECCKSVGDAQTDLQPQDGMIDQGAGSSNLFLGVVERGGFMNTHATTNSPQPVSLPASQSSSLRIDLNASPRDFSGEDHWTPSPVYGSGASTLSGRRHIQRRIRILLSINRPRQAVAESNIGSSVADLITPESVWKGDAINVPEAISEGQQDCRPASLSHVTLPSFMLKEGTSFRHVDGAKEQVQSLVRSNLHRLSRDAPLEHSSFKEVARKSTHTILAACGIEHRREMVSADVEPPDDCVHDVANGPADLARGCCSSCFNSFVKDVVLRIINFS